MDDWPTSMVEFCPLCGMPKVAGCACPGSGFAAGECGSLDLGLERDPLAGATNDVAWFAEQYQRMNGVAPDTLSRPGGRVTEVRLRVPTGRSGWLSRDEIRAVAGALTKEMFGEDQGAGDVGAGVRGGHPGAIEVAGREVGPDDDGPRPVGTGSAS